MNLGQLLLAIVPGHSRRHEAWPQLYALLDALSRSQFASASGGALRIPEEAREDVVQAVAIKVHQLSPLPVAGKSDGECRSYLLRMLRNRWIDEHRRRLHQEKLAQASAREETEEEAAPPEPTGLLGMESARRLLERVYRELHAHRAPRFRPELERAWAQLCELSFMEGDMDLILRRDEGVTEAHTPAERKIAQQRVHQSHSRLRKHLRNTADALARQGLLSQDDASMARQLIENLSRCQRLPAVGVLDCEQNETARAKHGDPS